MVDSDIKIVHDKVATSIEEMGFDLVEIRAGRSKKLLDITIVIYKKDGVSIDDCTGVSRFVYEKIEDLEGFENVALKVTSPGIDRVIRDAKEYKIFEGRGVKLLLGETWTGGMITGCDDEILQLETKSGMKEINIKNIKKAKLDYVEEVRKK